MASGNNRREQALKDEQAKRDANLTQAQTVANQPSELEKRLDAEGVSWLDMVEGKSGPLDFSKAKGIFYPGMETDAYANQDDDRTATGALQFGSRGANPTAFALTKQLSSDRRAERRSVNFSNAIAAKDASVRGSIFPLIAQDSARKSQALSTAAGLYGQSAQNVANYQPPPSPWFALANAAIGGLSSFIQPGGLLNK